jgi:hypothetical protein
MQEREFVLLPLVDVAPHFEHPILLRTCKQLLMLLENTENYSNTCKRVFPLQGWNNAGTNIMGILNVTPDSFSDGGKFIDIKLAAQHALEMVAEGVDIIDIGGQSTRPNAPEVTSEQEIERVVGAIKAVKQVSNAALSIDTFRADVAKAAIDAGCDMINGTRD